MNPGARRIPGLGLLGNAPKVSFTFDGQAFDGVVGESLAAALLAAGVRVVARSFKYHRPRGVVGIGHEEPSALLTIAAATGDEPNTRATTVELHHGLVARGQNAWPSVRHDITAVNDWLAPLFPAGFYYKTFMAPARAWPFYERMIRRIAGLGEVPARADEDLYTSTHAHADVLVAGAGAAGLGAALTAARAGARVILADENPWLGLGLLGCAATIDGMPASGWAGAVEAELATLDNVTMLKRACVVGRYEHGFVTVCQKLREAPAAGPGAPRWRLWKLRVKRTIIATGATERALVFTHNDRPGVMTASAAAGYLDRYGVLVGARIVVAAVDDSAHACAARLAQAGAEVTVVDARDGGSEAACAAGARVLWRAAVRQVHGVGGVTSVEIEEPAGARSIGADVVAMNGGWSPSLQLYAQTGGKPVWDEVRALFVPGAPEQGAVTVGACNGTFDLGAVLEEASVAGAAAAALAGFESDTVTPDVSGSDTISPGVTGPPRALRPDKAFVDIQNDVTLADIGLAVREGYRSVEHVKRYTTLGMGTDQGKLGGINGVRAIAEARGEAVSEVGTTRFRPPYVPVPLGVVAAHLRAEHHHPLRRTAAHELHDAAGCKWLKAGAWLRPEFYRRHGETDLEAVNREVLAVRRNAGMVDVSTLGKFEIAGPDSVEFLNRVYTNGWSTLREGMGRYGIMLREDGMVFDDGVTLRMGEQHFVMSTTTGGAGAVYEWMTRLLETRWPDLRVAVVPVTEQWFAMALAGPNARTILGRVAEGFDVSRDALPFMSARSGKVAGIPARVFRISFSGELGYEINVPAERGAALWGAMLEAGAAEELAPYGLESMGVLRLEKGHFIVGRESDGRVNPREIGLGALLSKRKWFIGKDALALPEMSSPRRRQLVGVLPAERDQRLPRGAHLVDPDDPDRIGGSQGWIASLAYSPTLGHDIALALLEAGSQRMGESMLASAPMAGERVEVQIVAPHFYDSTGERQRG